MHFFLNAINPLYTYLKIKNNLEKSEIVFASRSLIIKIYYRELLYKDFVNYVLS